MRIILPSYYAVGFSLLIMLGQSASAQANALATDTLNRVDELGRKQGWWQVAAPVADKPDYQAGKLIEEGSYADNKRMGTWVRYWPNGKVKSEINYVKGMPRGTYKLYYSDGKLEEQGAWDMDRNTGDFKRWHANGNLAQEFVFDAHGTRDGKQKYFHENGRLAVDVNIVKGREQGTLKRYFPNGDLEETMELQNGTLEDGSFRTFSPKSPVPAVKPPADAVPAPAKTAEETTNAMEFLADGYNTLYDSQHRLAQKGHYRKGRLWNGKVYKYDRNGILYKIEVFVDGRYAGKAQLTEDDR